MSRAWVPADEAYLCKLMRMMELAIHDVGKQHEDHERDAEAVAAHGTLPLLQRHNMCCWLHYCTAKLQARALVHTQKSKAGVTHLMLVI